MQRDHLFLGPRITIRSLENNNSPGARMLDWVTYRQYRLDERAFTCVKLPHQQSITQQYPLFSSSTSGMRQQLWWVCISTHGLNHYHTTVASIPIPTTSTDGRHTFWTVYTHHALWRLQCIVYGRLGHYESDTCVAIIALTLSHTLSLLLSLSLSLATQGWGQQHQQVAMEEAEQ
jgi:hypothetical protein